MARWLSPTWVTTSWVMEDWYGDGSTSSPGDWIGGSWFRPGYIRQAYLTNEGFTPTGQFVADTLGVGISEARSLLVRVRVTDTLGVQFSETFSTTYKRHVVAFDVVNISLNEQQLSRLPRSASDTLAVSLTETASNSEGNFLQISVEDNLDVEIDDPGINQGIQAVDTLSVGITETTNYTVSLSRTDTLDIGLTETSSRRIEGAIIVSTSDSLNIGLGEAANRRIFRPILVSDTLSVQFTETPTIQLGIIVVYLQAFDSLDLGVDEAASISAQVDTVAKTGSDSLDLNLSESTSKVELRFLSAGDILLVQVLEVSDTGKISIQQTWEDAQYPWGGSTLRDIKPLPVFAFGYDFYQVDSADTFVDNEPINVILERLGLTIYGRDRQGQWKEDPDVCKLVKGLFPIFRGEAGTVVNIYIGMQENMDGPVTWDGPHPFIFGESTAVKPLISGYFVAIRFESNGQKPWKLLSYDLDITTVGRRN